jgi:putative FmdB family regulatory protein
MPFYEYQCDSCGHTLEAMQKVSDAPLKKCPHCGKSRLQKLMSAPVFRLKGSGWYETDFKSDQDGKRNLADRPEAEAPKDEKKDKSESKDSSAGEGAKSDKPVDKTIEKSASADSSKKGPDRGGARVAKPKQGKRKTAARPARPAAKRSTAKSARRR